MSMLLCADGVKLEWPHSTGGVTTARSEHLATYLSKERCAADKCLAAAQLRPIQLIDLFDSPTSLQRARHLALCGRRITQTGTYQFARHMGETSIKKAYIVRGFDRLTREQVIARLMNQA